MWRQFTVLVPTAIDLAATHWDSVSDILFHLLCSCPLSHALLEGVSVLLTESLESIIDP
jgi:hypothetical protein